MSEKRKIAKQWKLAHIILDLKKGEESGKMINQ